MFFKRELANSESRARKAAVFRNQSVDYVAHRGYGFGVKDAVIRARVDESLKREAEKVLGALGLSTTEAIRMFLTQLTLHRGIPFPIVTPGSPLDVEDVLHPAEKRNSALDLLDED